MPIAIDDPVAWCVSQPVSVCHAATLCTNGRADRDPIQDGETWAPKEQCFLMGVAKPYEAEGRRFDADIAKLLWPLVYITYKR